MNPVPSSYLVSCDLSRPEESDRECASKTWIGYLEDLLAFLCLESFEANW